MYIIRKWNKPAAKITVARGKTMVENVAKYPLHLRHNKKGLSKSYLIPGDKAPWPIGEHVFVIAHRRKILYAGTKM